MLRRHCVWVWVVVCVLVCVLSMSFALGAKAQVNTATLSGIVTDPQGLPVHGAKVTVVSAVTGAERATVADDNGRYNLVGLPPGQYKLTVDGGANFASFENEAIVVSVGENASFNPQLQLRSMQQTVTVTTETAAIETTKTEVSQVVDERRIDNLPINGRNYINFTLTNSQTTRDVAPTIGPAPTSGLNVGGQRARSNEVSVDGADAVDNSINGIRATVSQEAVQEFQLILGRLQRGVWARDRRRDQHRHQERRQRSPRRRLRLSAQQSVSSAKCVFGTGGPDDRRIRSDKASVHTSASGLHHRRTDRERQNLLLFLV